MVLACGATKPRDLPWTAATSTGYTSPWSSFTNTKSLLDSNLSDGNYIDAEGKTWWSSAAATRARLHRHLAQARVRVVVNFELMTKPPDVRAPGNEWPQWPRIFRVDYGHEEATVETARTRGPTRCSPRSSFPRRTARAKSPGWTVRVRWVKDEATGRTRL